MSARIVELRPHCRLEPGNRELAGELRALAEIDTAERRRRLLLAAAQRLEQAAATPSP